MFQILSIKLRKIIIQSILLLLFIPLSSSLAISLFYAISNLYALNLFAIFIFLFLFPIFIRSVKIYITIFSTSKFEHFINPDNSGKLTLITNKVSNILNIIPPQTGTITSTLPVSFVFDSKKNDEFKIVFSEYYLNKLSEEEIESIILHNIFFLKNCYNITYFFLKLFISFSLSFPYTFNNTSLSHSLSKEAKTLLELFHTLSTFILYIFLFAPLFLLFSIVSHDIKYTLDILVSQQTKKPTTLIKILKYLSPYENESEQNYGKNSNFYDYYICSYNKYAYFFFEPKTKIEEIIDSSPSIEKRIKNINKYIDTYGF